MTGGPISRRALLAGAVAAGLGACATRPGSVAPEPDVANAPDRDVASAPTASTTGPSTTGPSTTGPSTTGPSTTGPSTTGPSTTGPSTTGPSTTAGAQAWTGGGPASFVRNGDRTRAEVALTFHTNGDAGLVTRLADLLAAARVPVTLFAVGRWVEAEPALVRRLLTDGHELANHTWSHPALGSVDSATMTEEITRCRDALAPLAPLAAAPVRWFRPSGIETPTEAILAAAGAAGYPVVVGYDVDSLDFTDPGADAVVANVENAIRPGSIISLHTGHADTVEAMGRLLALLTRRGLRPVTCATLLR